MATKTEKVYVVIWYSGGSEAGKWACTTHNGTDLAALEAVADEIESTGHPAMVNREDYVRLLGMPEGAPKWYDFATCKRLQDTAWARTVGRPSKPGRSGL